MMDIHHCLYYYFMIYYIAIAILSVCLYVFYTFYLKPKAEIKRYKAIFNRLGYKVFEQEFSFFGVSFVDIWTKGIKEHKDALYLESTVYPHVDVIIGNILGDVLIYLSHPDLTKEFLSSNLIYKYPKYTKLLELLKLISPGGLALTQGEDWKNKRKLISKVFNFDLLTKNIPRISAICDRIFDKADQKYSVQGNKFKYDVMKISGSIFNGVIMKCFLGSDQIDDEIKGMEYNEFVIKTSSDASKLSVTPLMVFFGKIAWKLGLTGQIRQCKDNVRLMRQKAMEIIKKRTEEVASSPKSEQCTDIIQALIYEKMENGKEFSYSDKEIIDEFQTFLVAGTDTTTHFFTMIVYYLGKYPQVQQKLRQQVNSIIKSDEDITHENLKKLTYIDWIQNETTRHYGPGIRNFERVAVEDNFIKDIPITKGTVVSTHQRGAHYSEEYFKDPWQFRPERWESECDGIHPYAFGGFSAGPRNCIGKHLAMLQSKIAIVKLIRRYESIEVPQEITKIFTLLYEPEPFQVTFTKKSF